MPASGALQREKDEQRRKLVSEVDELNSQKKSNTDKEKGKEIKEKLKEKEEPVYESLGDAASVYKLYEASAEEVIKNFLKLAQQTFDVPDIVDWEFVEFITNDDMFGM